uniref:Uncharacterized protein n=1 Tax=Anguilla anguilla TaxID=7936 RepID=A0A0E9PWV8_ANGAN
MTLDTEFDSVASKGCSEEFMGITFCTF